MTYYSDNEEEDCVDYTRQSEIVFDKSWNKCKTLLDNLKDNVQNTGNPYILANCDAGHILDFVEQGEFELPDYYYTLGKVNGKRSGDNLLYIPEPMEIYLDEQDTTEGWISIGPNGVKPIISDKQKEEELLAKKKQEEEEEEKIRARSEVNKHNWTMTKEARGIKQKPVVVEPPKPKQSRAQRRKNRRRGFQVKRIAHKYE